MALSKRLRYEILRRDNYACRYCGNAAPVAKLTVDHVTPVVLGGTDEPANLVTACVDCNAGKSSSNPDDPLVEDVSSDALRWAAAIAEASNLMLLEHGRRKAVRDQFLEAWLSWSYPGSKPGERKHFELPNNWANSIDNLLAAGLPVEVLCECVDTAMGQKYVKDPWRYTCGVAWHKVAALREVAGALIESSEDS